MSPPPIPTPPLDLDLSTLPGHQIRRLHQLSVAYFMQEAESFGVTPVQYAAMHTIGAQPGIDQRTLAERIGFDTSTIGGVIDRLENRGYVLRTAKPGDRRVRCLTLRPEGHRALEQLTPCMLRAQERMLAPLEAAERRRFMALLNRLTSPNSSQAAPEYL